MNSMISFLESSLHQLQELQELQKSPELLRTPKSKKHTSILQILLKLQNKIPP
jgi:hypothetical protein